jgi:hypothetical protein
LRNERTAAERGETIDDCVAHEKRLKRWLRDWKFTLIERGNPEWRDLCDEFLRPWPRKEEAGPRLKAGLTKTGMTGFNVRNGS